MKPLIIALMLAAAPLASASAQSIEGNWQRADGGTRVKISSCGGAICAVNTWIKESDSSEKVGDRLVMNVKPQGPSNMAGKAFDERRNMNFAMEINVASPKQITTRGCVVGGIICKTVSWNKLN